ncbi:MAG TPA: hypothetical protein VE643_06715 [Nitrososphaeraceae archaeon]|nr:hypothetical protein [Nitrososphaeraceae archaeon]
MQASSSFSTFTKKPTIEAQHKERLLTSPHEYIRDSLRFRYKNCISCRNRSQYTCIKCGYCYSCHWKREQLEEIEQRDNLKDFYVSLSKANKDNHQEKLKTHIQQHNTAEKDHQQIQSLEKWGTLDVLGQPAEPICTYYRCHHEFSLYGTRSCRCKHAMNNTLGISVRYH